MGEVNTLEYICEKYNIDLKEKSPFEINCGRWRILPRLIKELDFKVGAEIGVQKGYWTATLFRYNPDLKMYSIDGWTAYSNYMDIREQELHDEYYEKAKEAIKGYDCKLIKKLSMDAVGDFEDESLDFVYLDGNHAFEYITNDIAEWSKKVRKDGLIMGHDYWSNREKKERHSRISICSHVEDVVKAWAHSHWIHPWFVLDGNPSKSWMWVKE